MGEFISDLKSVFLLFPALSLFPFLMFLVALANLVISGPEWVLRTLTERMQGLLPSESLGCWLITSTARFGAPPPACSFSVS